MVRSHRLLSLVLVALLQTSQPQTSTQTTGKKNDLVSVVMRR
jgi:hypothetical protein